MRGSDIFVDVTPLITEPAMSDRRTLANRTNASKSTGPKTEHGKAVAGSNSMRHGIFSDCLFLQDEDPADYDRLQPDLQGPYARWYFGTEPR